MGRHAYFFPWKKLQVILYGIIRYICTTDVHPHLSPPCQCAGRALWFKVSLGFWSSWINGCIVGALGIWQALQMFQEKLEKSLALCFRAAGNHRPPPGQSKHGNQREKRHRVLTWETMQHDLTVTDGQGVLAKHKPKLCNVQSWALWINVTGKRKRIHSEDGAIQKVPSAFHWMCRTSLSFSPNWLLYLSKRFSRALMYISW